MITKENEEKLCSFYASDFHLEMIVLPYINKKLEENKKVVILTEENLKDSATILINKINLEEKRKRKLLEINWENNYNEKIEYLCKCTNKELCIIVAGKEEYMKKINNILENMMSKNQVDIVNCFKIDDIKNHMQDIIAKHSKVLNTSGIQKI